MLSKNNLAKLNKISDYLFRAGLVLTAIAMPLEIVPNKLLTLLAWAINLLLLQRLVYVLIFNRKSLKHNIKIDRVILIAFLLPLVAIGVSALGALNRAVSLLELRGLVILVLRALVIIMIASMEDIKLFIKAIYAMTAVVVAFGIFQYYGDLAGLPSKITRMIANYSSRGDYIFPRVHSLAHEPLYLASYLLISAGLLSGEIIINKKVTNKWLKILFLLVITLIILTIARGAIIGAIAGLILVFIATRDIKIIKQISIYVLVSFVLSLVMLGSASLFKKGSAVTSFSEHAVTTNDASVLNRTMTWKYAIKSFKSSPIIGVGGANSQYYIGEGAPAVDNSKPVNLFKVIVFNNTYLTFMSEYGVLGALCLVPMAYLLFLIAKSIFVSKPKSYIVGLFAFLIGLLLQAMSFEILLVMRFWMMLALLVAIWRMREISKEKEL
jgi:O-antigen ligase